MAAGKEIRIDGCGWIDLGNTPPDVIPGLAPVEYALELRSRDALDEVSDPVGPLYGTPVAISGFQITTLALPDGSVGEAYSFTLTKSGHTGTVTYAVHLGVLPTGLALNAGTGAITGTPTVAGIYPIVVRATDDNGTTDRYLTIRVAAAPTTYLLDDITATPAIAVSFRKLRSAYAGNCIRVRRADTTELNIGFDSNGNLDKEAAMAFGSDLRVMTFYDQSTNGNDLLANAYGDAPLLVYDKFSGRAALDFDVAGVQRWLTSDDTVAFTQLQAYLAIDPRNTQRQVILFDIEVNKFQFRFFQGGIELYNGVLVNCGKYNGGPSQVTVNFRSGNDRVYVDGVEKAAIDGDLGALNAGDSAGTGEIHLGRKSGTTGGGSDYVGYFAEGIWFTQDNISAPDKAEIESSQTANWITDIPAPRLSYSNLVTLEGDSRTYGFNTSGIQNAPISTPLQTLLGSAWAVRNVARSGQRLIQDYTPQAATQVIPFLDTALNSNIVVVWGIFNDLANDDAETLDAADLYAALTSYVTTLQAAGFQVIVCTETPVDDLRITDITVGQFAAIDAFNVLVIANTAGADAVVDFSDDADLTDPTDVAYFDDGLHLTIAAAAKAAALIEAAINSLDVTAPTITTAGTLTTLFPESVRLTWRHLYSADNVAVTGYEVRIKETSSGVWGSAVDAGYVTTYDFTGLTPETSYDVQRRAYDASGNYSAWTATVTQDSGEEPFDPTSIAGCVLWLKAGTFDGVLGDGDATGPTWTDGSAEGNNAVQAIGAQQPTYQMNEVNGKPVLRFDGSNDNFSVADDASLDLTNATIFVVAKVNSGNGNLVSKKNNGGDYTLNVFGDGVNDPGLWFFNGAYRKSGVVTDIRGGGFHVIEGFYDGTTLEYVLDGTLDSSASYSGSFPTGTEDLYIGTRASAGEALNGDIAEIIIYNTGLSGPNRTIIRNYLAAEYGL